MNGWKRDICLQCVSDEKYVLKDIKLEQICLARLTNKSTPPSVPVINYTGNPGPSSIIDSIDDLFDHLDNSKPCSADLSCTLGSSDCTGDASDRLHMAASYPFKISAFTNIKGGYTTKFCVRCINSQREQFKYQDLTFTQSCDTALTTKNDGTKPPVINPQDYNDRETTVEIIAGYQSLFDEDIDGGCNDV